MSAQPRGSRRKQADQRTVLIVEDEPLNLKLFAVALAKRGYRALQAVNGYQGFVRAHDERPDLIVMDVRMPGLSGLEVTRTLKDDAYTKDIPIIIATAFLIDEQVIRDSGCDGYMAKPFRIPEFIKLIDSVIERSRAARAADARAPAAA
ncbi:MAG: response regulator [Thiohalocapsa sp.]